MPLSTIPVITITAYLMPIAAAMTTLPSGSPPSEAFTLTGAVFAVALIVTYMRMKQPHIGYYALAFNVLATGAFGWLFPEVINYHWLRADMTPKSWGVLAMLCGLTGGTVITTILTLIHRRLPSALEKWADKAGLPPETKVILDEVTSTVVTTVPASDKK